MKLSVKGFALSAGITWGLAMLLGTFLLRIAGGHGQTIGKIAVLYRGYSLSWLGMILGMVYGYITGFVAGGLFAWIYNKFAIDA